MARARIVRKPSRQRPLQKVARAQLLVFFRDLVISGVAIWVFEYRIGYRFPQGENLILYFVAIPIIWSTLIVIWTSTNYREQRTLGMKIFTHAVAVILLVSTSFLISATLTTISATLDTAGRILFHFVGWTVMLGLIYYDVVDVGR